MQVFILALAFCTHMQLLHWESPAQQKIMLAPFPSTGHLRNCQWTEADVVCELQEYIKPQKQVQHSATTNLNKVLWLVTGFSKPQRFGLSSAWMANNSGRKTPFCLSCQQLPELFLKHYRSWFNNLRLSSWKDSICHSMDHSSSSRKHLSTFH